MILATSSVRWRVGAAGDALCPIHTGRTKTYTGADGFTVEVGDHTIEPDIHAASVVEPHPVKVIARPIPSRHAGVVRHVEIVSENL